MTALRPTVKPKALVGLFPALVGIGGVQEASRQTAAALDAIARSNGWRTIFLGLNDTPGDCHFTYDGRHIIFRGFGRAKISFLFCAAQATWGGARIVVAAHPNLAVAAECMKVLSPQVKVIAMAHGVEVWQPLPRYRRRALLSADLVVAPSTDTATKLDVIQGIPLPKIRRLSWSLSPDFIRLARAPSLPLLPGFPRGSVILTVGRWVAAERYKGLDDLIRATAQLRAGIPELHLVAVGGGDDLGRLQALATELGVQDCVHFLEGLSQEELAACYAQADVFALPSAGEGFGLVFLEAMAFGKPIVGAAIGGVTDLIEHHVNGLSVLPHDKDGLAQALSLLLLDDSLRSDLGRRGAEIVQQKYRFEVFQNELQRIVDECKVDSEAFS
jgi:glycosyltransferase involved in cell wall biosynthesis